MKLNQEQKNEIINVVAMGFETGHSFFEDKREFNRECPNLKGGWEYYCELVNLGPAGFYEEFKDVYTFDPMFIEEYGFYDDEEEEDDD